MHPGSFSRFDAGRCIFKHKTSFRRNSKLARGFQERAGFRALRVTSFVSLLLPGMAAARRLQRDRSTFDPCAEMRLPGPLEAVCTGSLRVEVALIKRGVSFPAGGSLFVVARRR